MSSSHPCTLPFISCWFAQKCLFKCLPRDDCWSVIGGCWIRIECLTEKKEMKMRKTFLAYESALQAEIWNLKLKITTSTAVHCGKQTFIKDFPVLIDFWQFWLLFLLNRCLSNNQTGCDMQTLPSMIWVQIENFSIAIFNHLSTQNSNFLWKSFHLKSFFPPSEILLFLFIRSLPCASAAGWARIESKTVSCCCYRERAIKIN